MKTIRIYADTFDNAFNQLKKQLNAESHKGYFYQAKLVSVEFDLANTNTYLFEYRKFMNSGE